jgi:hypothetical protein
MKLKMFSAVWLIVALSVFSLAFTPLHIPLTSATNPLDVIITIAAGFASLAGVAALVAVLVQIGKYFGVVKDATANQWTAGLNLIAFIALMYFGVFQPSLTLALLDGYASQIAEIAVFILGFLVQMTTSKPVYALLKYAKVPVLGYSHSA